VASGDPKTRRVVFLFVVADALRDQSHEVGSADPEADIGASGRLSSPAPASYVTAARGTWMAASARGR
jgi:hypothetical protein